MPSAADEYAHNLLIFKSLTGTDNKKLHYDKASGRFSLIAPLSRAWGNVRASSKQTITNWEVFRDPVVQTFASAVKNNSSRAELDAALVGIEALRKVYTKNTYKGIFYKKEEKEKEKENENERLVELEETIAKIRTIIAQSQQAPRLDADIRRKLALIDADAVLGPAVAEFLHTVWEHRTDFFNRLDGLGGHETPNATEDAVQADLTRSIYCLYFQTKEEVKQNQIGYFEQIQAFHKEKVGNESKYYYEIQKPKENEKIYQDDPNLELKEDFEKHFVFYRTDYKGQTDRLWRVYLHSDGSKIKEISKFLWDKAKEYQITSFKVAGWVALTMRCDNIVVYASQTGADALAQEMADRAAEFSLLNSTPAMTIVVGRGVAKGIEPGCLTLGFDREDAEEAIPARLQSFGKIRSQLIASAFIHMHEAMVEDPKQRTLYRNHFDTFKKWVAIAFEGYAAELDGQTR